MLYIPVAKLYVTLSSASLTPSEPKPSNHVLASIEYRSKSRYESYPVC